VAQTGEISESIVTRHGTKYVVDGLLATPSGRSVAVRTVWIIEDASLPPRLVTAYPL
jgi:hypothetical protein